MSFEFVENQYYFFLIVGLLGIFIWYRKNGKKTERFLRDLFQEKKQSFVRRRTFRFLSILLAMSLGIIALMGPKWGWEEVESQSNSAEIILILDHSASMLAEDIAMGLQGADEEGYEKGYERGVVSRFEFSKELLGELLDSLEGYKVAFILASRSSQIEVPFTLNRELVRELYLERAKIAPNRLQGTKLGQALESAVNLASPESTSTKVLLVSDGEDHGSNMDMVLSSLKRRNITVFTVGLGTEKGSYIPMPNRNYPFKVDAYGNWVISSLNDKLLKRIADETNGRYFSSESEDILAEIQDSLVLDSEGEKSNRKSLQQKEQFQIFLLMGFLVFLGSFWLYSFRTGWVQKFFKSRFWGMVLVFFFIAGLTSEEKKGSEYYSSKEYEKAIEEYSLGIQKKEGAKEEQKEKVPGLHFHRGNSYYRLKQYDQSEKDYYQGMSQTERTRQESLFLYNLGKTAFEQKKFSESLGFYRKSLEADPTNQDARHNYFLLKKRIETQDILIEGEEDEGTGLGAYPLEFYEGEGEMRNGVDDTEIQDRLAEIYRRDQENRLRMNERVLDWSWYGNKDW